jgi:hypothetical protein
VDPKFLSSTEAVSDTALPIFQVTAGDFVPSLLPHDLERIDNTCEQDSSRARDRAAPATFSTVRASVTGSKQDRPDVSDAFKNRNPRQCASCEKVSKDRDLRMCSRRVMNDRVSSQTVLTLMVIQMQASILL